MTVSARWTIELVHNLTVLVPVSANVNQQVGLRHKGIKLAGVLHRFPSFIVCKDCGLNHSCRLTATEFRVSPSQEGDCLGLSRTG